MVDVLAPFSPGAMKKIGGVNTYPRVPILKSSKWEIPCSTLKKTDFDGIFAFSCGMCWFLAAHFAEVM